MTDLDAFGCKFLSFSQLILVSFIQEYFFLSMPRYCFLFFSSYSVIQERKEEFTTMPATIIDGKKIAETIRSELKLRVDAIKVQHPGALNPGLCAIIVGGRKDSETYVRLKHKAAEECGFVSIPAAMPEDTTQEQLEAKIEELNNDPQCHGIIVQLPLPSHLSEEKAILKINPSKDADCLHPYNVGMMALRGQKPTVLPCTPAGVIELLKRSNVVIFF
ncbi:C-1-tetrahydrofolate synthase, cytoplasmic, putative [Bodo saltans]|uniref:methenyltetrahydrofolate cyclohydrolase n=1 Tax=Bodo saltans TaxID=75058 RepID=A0A0S4J0R7_BODSA|nr:C-1-tetrahydrofolate synthase, cytoplasmic, putative [Bodo saltans]|eukprot:CUG49528.1 C-1-tetrahydrofolate synthase, cytoplasmic, putative [Bodo saltans]